MWDLTLFLLFFNLLCIMLLLYIDLFYFAGEAKEHKTCTHREWKKRRKGWKNIVLWTSIRDCVPRYLYVFHLITLIFVLLGLVFPFFCLFVEFQPSKYVTLFLGFWMVFCVLFIYAKSFYDSAVSPDTNVLKAALAIIFFLMTVATMIYVGYKLMDLLGWIDILASVKDSFIRR